MQLNKKPLLGWSKLAVFALVFLFILTPLLRVFADETTAPVSPDTEVTTPSENTPDAQASPGAPVTAPSDDSTIGPSDNSPDTITPDTQVKPNKESRLAPSSLSSSEPVTSPSSTPGDLQKKSLLPNIDETSGALIYSYPITIPPGRNSLQPDLKLNYNSQYGQEGDELGYGWNIGIPYIERINRKGFDQLYSQNYFNSSLSGELVNTGTDTYAAKIENGDFLNYTFSSNQWLVKDKKGTQYKFGYNSSAQLVDPANTTRIYRWMLEEVRDTNDNYIAYAYSKDSNQIYPSTITYTGNGVTIGIFQIAFVTSLRPINDQPTSYKTGFSVQTKYRITEIDAKVNSTIARKYVLAYTTGYNGNRSLLNTITESGQDDSTNWVTLPSVAFTYQTPGITGWTRDTSHIVSPLQTHDGVEMIDVNGDGLADLIQSWADNNGIHHNTTYLDNGDDTWSSSSSWAPPVDYFDSTTYSDRGVRMGDFNGDGFPDIVQHQEPSGIVSGYLNNGSAAWSASTAYGGNRVVEFSNSSGTDTGSRLVDINGDGLPDNIQSTGSQTPGRVVLNDGTQFLSTGDSGWTFPTDPTYGNYVDYRDGSFLVDVNNDGLVDIVQAFKPESTVTKVGTYLNNGNKSWIYSPNWNFPGLFVNGSSDQGYRPADINGDGLVDFVQRSEPAGLSNTYLNNGNGWTLVTGWTAPLEFSYSNSSFDPGTKIGDINGDGMVDFFRGVNEGTCCTAYTYINQAKKSDLLKTIIYPQGGTSTVTYQATPLYKNGFTNLNSNLPLVLDTVQQMVTDDGSGNTATMTYSYQGGKYFYSNAFDRKFSGFNKIIKTDAAGNAVTTFYHQGDSSDSTHGEYSDEEWKIGKPYRVEVADSSGNLYAKTINKWDSYDLGSGNKFVKLAQTVSSTYDGDSTHKDKAESYTYSNTNGNITQKVEYGQVTGSDDGTFTDSGTDDFTTTYTYASDGAYIVGLPDDITTTDHAATKVKEDKFYYDTQVFGTVTKGNQTKNEKWKTGSTYVNTQRTYNSTYGTLASVTDERSKTTSYSNDTYNLYPATVTNPLTHVTSYTYDYSSGQVIQKTDPNTRVFQNVYDGLDRLIEEKQADLTTPATLVTKSTYSYVDLAAAPTFDAQTTGNSGNVTSYTLAHTTSGTNRFLVVGVTAFDDTVSGVTYNGVAMTKLDSANYGHGFSVWYQLNPAAGLHDVVVSNSQGRYMTVVINSFSGVNQTIPMGAYSATETGNGTSESQNTPSALGDLVLSMLSVSSVGNGAATVTSTSGQTERSNVTGNNQTTDINRTVSTTKLGSAGTTSMSYTLDRDNYKLHYSFALKPVDVPNSIKKSDYLDGSSIVDSYVYKDGLGRTIQERKEAEGTNFSVKDILYNNLGLVQKESLPYFSTGSSKTSATTDTTLYTTYTYDPMQRVATSTNNLGTTTNTYNDWKLTITDANNKPKDLYKDTYGNLVQVDEHNSGSTYSTYYVYDYLGDLTKITDALSNIRNFTYDGLGRRLTAQDLHASADTSYGSWSYTYDDAGNLTQTVNPNSQTINDTYDDINRQLTEDYTGQAGTEVTYTYDSGTDGIGRLTGITTGSISQTNTYNALGGLKSEAKTINSTLYTTTYDYDRQGNQINITNPDSSQVKYIFNSAGLLNQVQRKESTDAGFTDIVSNYDYSPTEQPTTITYNNGAVTTNIYDSTKLYRLTAKVTVIAGSSHAQDLAYTYDPVGNITQIVDALATDTAKTANYVFDDLYRLSSATITAVASGQSTYTHAFVYNAIGDILTRTETIGAGSPVTYTYTYAGNTGTNYANPHAVTSISDGTNTTTYTYDNNGNTTASGGTIYSFDYNNRLTQAVIPGSPTTTSFFPQAGDGSVNFNSSSSWSTTHDSATGSTASATGTTFNVDSGKAAANKYQIDHGFIPFDTSSLPDNANISSAKLKTFVDSKSDADNDGDDWVSVVQSTQTSSSTLATSDYSKDGSATNPTEGIDTSERKDITSVTTGAYLVFNLNSTGQSWISKTGSTKLGLREGHDAINSAFTGSNSTTDQLVVRSSEYTGTSSDPILEVTFSTPTTVTYAYDAVGQRIKYANGSSTTYYPTKFYNTDGTTPQKHAFANGMEIGVVKGTGGSAVPRYIHTDHLTGSNVVTNSSDTKDEIEDYFPFGGIRFDEQPGSFSEQRKFIGQEYDADTSLNYLNARYYNSAIGKFISEDPTFLAVGGQQYQAFLVNPQSQNSYSYANNNPLTFSDPAGLFSIKQAWNNSVVWIGNKAQGAYQSNSTARWLLDHPESGLYVAIGASIGAEALGLAAVTGISTIGTRCIAACDKVGQDSSTILSRGWSDPKSLNQHYQDHGSDFGAKSTDEYASKASNFFNNAQKNGYEQISGKDGTIRIYDPKTNTFGSYNADGSTKTFFKPAGGQNYWNTQVSDSQKIQK